MLETLKLEIRKLCGIIVLANFGFFQEAVQM
jgi:hypothetical protein